MIDPPLFYSANPYRLELGLVVFKKNKKKNNKKKANQCLQPT